ncbi:MAG: L,D-transpeptidase family protein [Pseudomonadota bacterium]|nr:L,D-transpeptidase family protein [Pseudomonadota bacterium]MEC9022344.1 L,D-transpeptidase family protein [Pseudomonadota bacterium]
MQTQPQTRREFILSVGSSGLAGYIFFGTKIASGKNKSSAENSIIGKTGVYFAKHEDTLLDIARLFGLGFVEIVAANQGVSPWIPGQGKKIRIPGAHIIPEGRREGILINISDQRLYWFKENGGTKSYPIGTGKEAWETPIGSTKILSKQKNPIWFVPESVRKEDPKLPKVIPPGPQNPLGRHAFYLGWPSYLIHGTNIPWGVGRRVSHGCIRMYPEDIAEIFNQIKVGTKVTVIYQEAKLSWIGSQIYLEVHPNRKQNLELEERGTLSSDKVSELPYRIKEISGQYFKNVDWRVVRKTELERTGIPVPILKRKIGS